MPGFTPGIHVFAIDRKQDVDGRDKPGRDPKRAKSGIMTFRKFDPLDRINSARPRDPAFARFASFGGFESAEARSAKAESGGPGLTEQAPLDSRLRGNERTRS
jgi:hypothetical protein